MFCLPNVVEWKITKPNTIYYVFTFGYQLELQIGLWVVSYDTFADLLI